jgi:hypothetical protein
MPRTKISEATGAGDLAGGFDQLPLAGRVEEFRRRTTPSHLGPAASALAKREQAVIGEGHQAAAMDVPAAVEMLLLDPERAARCEPSSSIRCQNGPVWLRSCPAVQVRQPANSPSVATWRSGGGLLLKCGVGDSSCTCHWPSIVDLRVLKSDRSPLCQSQCKYPGPAAAGAKLWTGWNMGRKRPFPRSDSVPMKQGLRDQRPTGQRHFSMKQRAADHPRAGCRSWLEAR